MDHTPQPESKHGSEVPIFSVSTAEEDDDVEEYVEEEEYDDDDDPRTLEEVSKDISKLHERIKAIKVGLNAALQAIEDSEKANRIHRSKTSKKVSRITSKVKVMSGIKKVSWMTSSRQPRSKSSMRKRRMLLPPKLHKRSSNKTSRTKIRLDQYLSRIWR